MPFMNLVGCLSPPHSKWGADECHPGSTVQTGGASWACQFTESLRGQEAALGSPGPPQATQQPRIPPRALHTTSLGLPPRRRHRGRLRTPCKKGHKSGATVPTAVLGRGPGATQTPQELPREAEWVPGGEGRKGLRGVCGSPPLLPEIQFMMDHHGLA